jgi:hypothetical protein
VPNLSAPSVVTKAGSSFAETTNILKESVLYKHGQDVITNDACKDIFEKTGCAFAFIRDGGAKDHKYPFHTVNKLSTMGLNGILVAFDKELYGTARINLFQGSVEAVFKLLSDFIQYRDDNAEAIFDATVKHMSEYEPPLHKDLETHTPEEKAKNAEVQLYVHFRQLMNTCVKGKHRSGDLKSIGLGLKSFCQSWDVESEEPKFSVASPHFQTRVYVCNSLLFEKHVSEVHSRYLLGILGKEVMINAYTETVSKLCQAFVKNDYTGAFIDLDMTLKSLKMMKNLRK